MLETTEEETVKAYMIKIEDEDSPISKNIGPFLDRNRAERTLVKAIGTVATSGTIEPVNLLERDCRSLNEIRDVVIEELAHTMKNDDARRERANNIVQAIGDDEFGVDMVYDMLTPNEAHDGIDDQMERDRSAHLIVKICNMAILVVMTTLGIK